MTRRAGEHQKHCWTIFLFREDGWKRSRKDGRCREAKRLIFIYWQENCKTQMRNHNDVVCRNVSILIEARLLRKKNKWEIHPPSMRTMKSLSKLCFLSNQFQHCWFFVVNVWKTEELDTRHCRRRRGGLKEESEFLERQKNISDWNYDKGKVSL